MLKERAERFLSAKKPPYALNLACGDKPKEGFIGVDKNPRFSEICWDLEQYPWPFPNNSVGEVHCSQFLEHVDDLPKFLNELYRVCKNGANIYFETPYYTSIFAMQDPEHKRVFSEMTFLYFDKKWRQSAGIVPYPIQSDFRIKKIVFGWDKRMVDAPEEEKQFAREHYFNVIATLGVVMQCVKEEAE